MTSDGEALLRAVCENPRDDTPRLIYADWLDEHGQPERAAFIRFECEFPQWDHTHPRYEELLQLERRFAESHAAWRAELPALPGVKWGDVWFDRGFVESVQFRSGKAFTAHADAVFAATPVQRLDVSQLTDRTIAVVLRSPYLGRLRQLILRGNYDATGVRLLADCPHLGELESLCLWGACGDDAAVAVAACPSLGGLVTLSFSNQRFTDRGATALIESERLRSVRHLVLHGTRGLSGRVVRRLKKRYDTLN
jgi:uncharacterized protein (TIGR02996 family)